MSKLNDLYQKASVDGDLKTELMAVNKKLQEEKTLTKETAIPEVILIAAKYGITLEPADFEQLLTDDQLESVAGGCSTSTLVQPRGPDTSYRGPWKHYDGSPIC
ncbi:hypothetical protein AGMMS49928_28900 [Spirochaetia bacterium]|nr:hypothetical protein AGMMS49928_28900 [Spirochaetia bacterium]